MSQTISRAESGAIQSITQSPHKKVKVAVADIDGILRGKYIHKEKFLSALEGGLGFCDVIFGWDCHDKCYDNGSFTGWHTGYPDAQARLDMSTLRWIPWESRIPFLLADFDMSVCPRRLLRRVIQRCKDAGFKAKMGLEFEWFNFKETPKSLVEKGYSALQPLTPGMFGYSLQRAQENQEFFQALMDEMNSFGIPLEGLHTETGPGVLEAAILYNGALEAADRGALFKNSVKAIAQRFGIMPTFMARCSDQYPGCSGHIHQSLCDEEDQALFYDSEAPQGASKLLKHYLAGQIQCLPEILPFYAPNINSYKRLVEGYWAPTHACWGFDNRTTAFRVISGSAKSSRIETRVSGADINPYLAIAASLASGLYGIQNELELPVPAVAGSGYRQKEAKRLPRTLQEATEKLKQSKVAQELFGHEFVDHFVRTREWECRQSEEAISPWELQRYFEIT